MEYGRAAGGVGRVLLLPRWPPWLCAMRRSWPWSTFPALVLQRQLSLLCLFLFRTSVLCLQRSRLLPDQAAGADLPSWLAHGRGGGLRLRPALVLWPWSHFQRQSRLWRNFASFSGTRLWLSLSPQRSTSQRGSLIFSKPMSCQLGIIEIRFAQRVKRCAGGSGQGQAR